MTAKDLNYPPTRRHFLVATTALALGGCSGGSLIGPPSPAPQIYALNPVPPAVFDAPQVGWQLVVAVPVAPAVLDSDRIALERAPNAMDYYANSQWTDRLPSLVQSLLVQTFERSGKITAVGRESAGLRPDYVLETEIRDFEAFYAVIDTPPKIRVKLVAKLLTASSHEMAGSVEVSHEAQAAANDMTSITAAFAQAAGAAVAETAAWTLRTGRPR
jgi:cholesterol transport system auxiliary component